MLIKHKPMLLTRWILDAIICANPRLGTLAPCLRVCAVVVEVIKENCAMSQIGARLEPEPGDLTPMIGAQTDVAPLGRDTQKPSHELTHTEDVDDVNWEEVANMSDFKS